MALLFMDGFEGYGTTTGSGTAVTDLLRNNYMVRTTSFDDFHLRLDAEGNFLCLTFGTSANAASNALTYLFDRDIAVTGDTITIGMRFKTRDHTNGTAEQPIIEINGNTTGVGSRHIALLVDYTNDRFVLRRGGTLIDNSAGSVIGSDTWYHIEFQFKIDDTTGLYELRLNGTDVMSDTNVDTKQGSAGFHDIVSGFTIWGINGDDSDDISGEFAIDDLYVFDDSGAQNNGFTDENTRVRTVFPTANGTTNDFTPSTGMNYQTVDDNPISESDYNDGATNGDIDEYEFDTVTENNIYAAMIQVNVAPDVVQGGNGFRTIRGRCRSGATIGNGDDVIVTGSRNVNAVFDVDPNLSAQWTLSNLTAAEFGVEVRD